jgi:hypothetical protein
MSWNLRIRGPGGQATLAATADTAISELQQHISDKIGVPVQLQELLSGFPPKQLQVRQHDMIALVMPVAVHEHSLPKNKRCDVYLNNVCVQHLVSWSSFTALVNINCCCL